MMKTGRAVFGLALCLFLGPYFLLARQIPNLSWPENEELFWALRNSFLQAAGSAILALAGGLFLLSGLMRIRPRFRSVASWALLTPSLFPPLFLLLAFLSWMDPFPVGWVGIVLIQGFMNAGLIAVLLLHLFDSGLGGIAEAALVMGASRGFFLRRTLRWLAPDFFSLGLFVFAASFASFSIPFVVGGGRATTLEILIYEKIRITGQWGQALSLSLIQLAIVAGFAFLPRSELRVTSTRATDLRPWGSVLGGLATVIYLLLFWGPLLKGVPDGVAAIGSIPGLTEDLSSLVAPTFLSAFGTGVCCLALLLFFSLGFPENWMPRLMRGWLAPSTALLGFAFLILSDSNAWVTYVAALTLIFVPAVYRLGMDRGLEGLQSQIDIARTLGATDFLIWSRVVVPQIWPLACLLAGVASLWALGEFALGRVLLGGPKTWALLAESLMSSYRIEAGLGVGTLILGSGVFLFLIFWGASRVRH